MECHNFEECEYNGQPECRLPDGMRCPHGVQADKPVAESKTDIEALIERLNQYSQSLIAFHMGGEFSDMFVDAATALSTIQAENAEMQQQLNEFSEFLCYMTGGLLSKTNYMAQEMVTAAEDYQQKVCGECDLRVENEKLLAENNVLRKMQPVELNGEAARSLSLALEVSQLRAELESVRAERNAAVEDVAAIIGDVEEIRRGYGVDNADADGAFARLCETYCANNGCLCYAECEKYHCKNFKWRGI